MSAILPTGPLSTVATALGVAGKITPQGAGWIACCPSHEDNRHSLSIGTGRDGRALLSCHAGCSIDAILSALHLTANDLFPPRTESKNGTGDRITDIYEYTDEHGRVLYEVCRFFPKTFKQRVPQPGGGYTWKLGDTPRVWFKLPSLLQGLTQGKVTFICEGEKDANRLAELGLIATSLAGGAAFTGSRHFANVATAHFRGARIVLLPDNDEPGREHMQRIADRLTPLATWVRTLALPGLAEKGDVSDWLDAGGDVAQLKALVASTQTAVAPPRDVEPTHEDSGDDETPLESMGTTLYPRTHFGNRDRFVDAMRDDLRYVAALKQWYRWDGQRFAPDETLSAEREAQATIRSLRDEAAATVNETQRSFLFKWAAKCATAGAVDQILSLAKSDPALARSPNDFDRDLDALNVQNGVVDLRTGVLRPHRRADDCTKLAPVVYDPAATCPKWESFLARVVPDVEVRRMLRIAVGYSLTGHIREECLFLLWGTGRNGKGTFFETLRLVAGDYAVQSDFETFLESNTPGGSGAARGDLARLQGSRFVTTSEAGEGKRLNEAMLKSITGGDTITARQLYAKEVEFTPQFTLWMAANHRPVIKGGDDGIWSRMRLVPFTVRIPDGEIDRTLKAALRDELPGILAWAVSGAIQWYREGLPFPDAVMAATASYRDESDVLGEFIEERCTVAPAERCQASEVYKAYKQWVSDRGDSEVSNTAFGRKLTDRGFPAAKVGGQKFRVGLSVQSFGGGLL